MLVVLVGSGLLGGLTSLGQTSLPTWLNPLSNSCGGWTAFAFLLVWVGRPRWLLAPLLGVLSFELLVEGYAVVSGLRGYYYAAPFSTIWSAVGLVAGPLLGWAAALVARGSARGRVVGAAVPAAVWLGEGVYSLTWVSQTTGHAFWVVEILASVAAMTGVLARARVSRGFAVLAVALWLLGALVLYLLLRTSVA